MNERDARLLPRLLDVMQTLDNERELGMAVLQVRRILADDGMTIADLMTPPAAADQIDMADARHDVMVRIRDLGLMLRLASHSDPVVVASMARARVAMENGTPVAGDDLRRLLSCLRDLMKTRLDERAAPAHGPRQGRFTARDDPYPFSFERGGIFGDSTVYNSYNSDNTLNPDSVAGILRRAYEFNRRRSGDGGDSGSQT